jgi:hypothetical protein
MGTVEWFDPFSASFHEGEPPLRWASPAHSGSMQQCPAACSTAALHDLTPSDTADAGTHGHRTPTADTGRRTPGRSDRTLDTGRWTDTRGDWTSAPDTGCRPLAEDVDTLTKARPASAPPGPPRPAAARWATQRCSCGQRLRRLASMQARRWGHLPARDCLLPCRVAAQSLRRLSRASVALLSSEDCGSSVERRGGSHPVHAGREDAYGVRCSVCWVERVAGCSGRCVKLGEVI